jgi:hypothetical protein
MTLDQILPCTKSLRSARRAVPLIPDCVLAVDSRQLLPRPDAAVLDHYRWWRQRDRFQARLASAEQTGQATPCAAVLQQMTERARV